MTRKTISAKMTSKTLNYVLYTLKEYISKHPKQGRLLYFTSIT